MDKATAQAMDRAWERAMREARDAVDRRYGYVGWNVEARREYQEALYQARAALGARPSTR